MKIKVGDKVLVTNSFLTVQPELKNITGEITKIEIWQGELSPENHGTIEVNWGLLANSKLYSNEEYIEHYSYYNWKEILKMKENYLTGIVIEMPEDDEASEEFYNEFNSFLDELDEITEKYSCGQDDGLAFIASRNDQVLSKLKEKYPDYELQQLNVDDYAWDQLYLE